jgi:hypothetical protein
MHAMVKIRQLLMPYGFEQGYSDFYPCGAFGSLTDTEISGFI